jgi:DNA-binding phage protein
LLEEEVLMAARTGGERYLDAQRKDPAYRVAYGEARERIGRTDELVRSLDARREARGLTKAELARQAGLPPEAVRRLFTMQSPNPTAGTLIALAEALDLDVVAVPKTRSSRVSSRAGGVAKSKKRVAAR